MTELGKREGREVDMPIKEKHNGSLQWYWSVFGSWWYLHEYTYVIKLYSTNTHIQTLSWCQTYNMWIKLVDGICPNFPKYSYTRCYYWNNLGEGYMRHLLFFKTSCEYTITLKQKVLKSTISEAKTQMNWVKHQISTIFKSK